MEEKELLALRALYGLNPDGSDITKRSESTRDLVHTEFDEVIDRNDGRIVDFSEKYLTPKQRQIQDIDDKITEIEAYGKQNQEKWNNEARKNSYSGPMGMFAQPSQFASAAIPKEQKDWSAALAELRQARKNLDTYTEQDDQEDTAAGKERSGWSTMWDGLTNQTTEDVADLLTFGLTTTANDIKISKALAKASKGEPLSEIEQMMVDSYRLNRDALQYVADRGGATTGYTIGSSLPQSAQFMGETILTGGSLGVVKAGMKQGIKGLAKGLGTAAYREALRTPLRGSMYGKMTETEKFQYGVGEDGEVTLEDPVSFAENLWDSYASTFAEGVSEQVGRFMPDKWVGNLAQKALKPLSPTLAKIPPKVIGAKASAVIGGSIEKVGDAMFTVRKGMSDVANFNGTVNEYLEEQVSMLIEPLLTGEPERIKEMFNSKTQLATLGSVGLFGSAMNVIASPFTISNANHLNKMRQNTNSQIASIKDENLRQGIYDVLKKNNTIEQMAEGLSTVTDWAKADPLDVRNTIGAYISKIEYDVHRGSFDENKVESLADNELLQFKKLFDITKNQNTGLVHELVDDAGNRYYQQHKDNEADDVVIVRNSTGTLEQKSKNELKPARAPFSYEDGAREILMQLSQKVEQESARAEREEAVENAESSNVAPSEYQMGDEVVLSTGENVLFKSLRNDNGRVVADVVRIDEMGYEDTITVDYADIVSKADDSQDLQQSVNSENTQSQVAYSQQTEDLQEVQNVQEPVKEQPQIPLLKDGTPDYEAMSPDMFVKEYGKKHSEQEALEDLQGELSMLESEISKSSAKVSINRNERAKNRDKISAMRTKADEIRAYLAQIEPATTTEQRPSFAADEQISTKYTQAPKEYGTERSIYTPGNEKIDGRYVLLESGTVTPSHDARSFNPSVGFPQDENGSTVNDRDYSKDTEAQRQVVMMANAYNGRALDNPVVVSPDGIVVSGNNRTMSGELAAAQGTDSEYVEHLKNTAAQYGFTPEQVANFTHPRIVFETKETPAYNTETFAKFNAQETKTQNKVERAVRIGKTIAPSSIKRIAGIIDEHETLGDFYGDQASIAQTIKTLQTDGIINANEIAELKDGDNLSAIGKDMVETLLVGSVLSEDAVRLVNRDGMRKYRNRITKAILPVVENSTMGDYSIADALSEAVTILDRARTQRGTVDGVTRQLDAFEQIDYSPESVAIAKALEGSSERGLRDLYADYNRAAAASAAGQRDLLTGGVQTKQEILQAMGIAPAAAVETTEEPIVEKSTRQPVDAIAEAKTPEEKHKAVSEFITRMNETAKANVSTFTDIKELPEELQNAIISDKSNDKMDIEGVTFKNMSYITTPLMNDKEHVSRTYVHEVIGHQFIDAKISRNDRMKLFETILNSFTFDDMVAEIPEFSEIITQYSNGYINPLNVAREYLGYLAGDNISIGDLNNSKNKLSLSVELSTKTTNEELINILKKAANGIQTIRIRPRSSNQAGVYEYESDTDSQYGHNGTTGRTISSNADSIDNPLGDASEQGRIKDYLGESSNGRGQIRADIRENEFQSTNRANTTIGEEMVDKNGTTGLELEATKNGQRIFIRNYGDGEAKNPFLQDDSRYLGSDGARSAADQGGGRPNSPHTRTSSVGGVSRVSKDTTYVEDVRPSDASGVGDSSPEIPDVQNQRGSDRVEQENSSESVGDSGVEGATPQQRIGENNKLVSADRIDELRKRAKELFNQLNSGYNPELFAVITELSAGYIEHGVRKFAEFTRAMTAEFGDVVKPYLAAMYEGARRMPGMEEISKEMDSTTYVDNYLHDKQITKKNGTTRKRNANRSVPNTNGSGVSDVDGRESMGLFSPSLQFGQPESVSQRESGQDVRPEEGVDGRGNVGTGGTISSDTNELSEFGAGELRLGQPTDDRPVGENEVPHLVQRPRADRNLGNFRIADLSKPLAPNGEISKIKANIEAIKLLKSLNAEGIQANDSEKAILSQYSGWGGLATVLDRRSTIGAAWDVKYKKYHDQIKELLTEQEFTAAINSTISAHYTSPEIISAIWGAVSRLGFKGGSVLEPAMGIGNFYGAMPVEIAKQSRLSGYELDAITGGIAKLLYPDVAVKIAGYETATEQNGSIDLVITNVPFGKTAPYDTKNKDLSSFSLHNYFIAKGLRQLKDGGLGVFVTSSSTMDSRNSTKFREWSERDGNADFIGAIRMPNTAFEANAGTSVTTDILFYRKRNGILRSESARAYEGLETIRTVSYKGDQNMRINEYFASNPQMMLGEMKFAFEVGKGGLYSDTDQTLQAKPEADLSKELMTAIEQLPDNIFSTASTLVDSKIINSNADDMVSTFVARDGKVYEVLEDGLRPITGVVKIKGKEVAKDVVVSDFLGIKDGARNLVYLEQNSNDDAEVEAARAELDKAYDTFVSKYGKFNRNTNLNFLQDDIQYIIPYSIENVREYYEKSKSGKDVKRYDVTKSDILSRRINRPIELPQSVESAEDAVNLSIRHKGSIDTGFIAKLLSIDAASAEMELLDNGLAFINPQSGKLEQRSEYLSGYVKDKLELAKEYAKSDQRYESNVAELERVIPKDIAPSDVNFRLGSYWIPAEYVRNFFRERFGVRADNIKYFENINEWVIGDLGYSSKDQTVRGYRSSELAAKVLNQRPVVVYDKIGDRNVKNVEATAEVAAKMAEINDSFIEYIQGNDQAMTELATIYNARFNNYVDRVYETESGYYPGANRDIELGPHQSNAVQRMLNDSVLLAHEVGTGKTFVMITGAMEMRRLGIAKKPMIVVQNSTLEQFSTSFQQLYPSAKLLVPSEKQRSAEGRQRTFAMIAYGEWDAVIIPQSFVDYIEDDPKRVEAKLQKDLDALNDALEESSNDYSMQKGLRKKIKQIEGSIEKNASPKVKDIARAQLSAEKRFKKQSDRRTDKVFTFEELGVDALIVDEAHAYKKLGFSTNMGNVKGIDTGVSKRAFSMKMKTEWIQDKTGGRNVVFATGTPITNTMAEAWTMMRFIAPDILKRYGIENFDAFASTFGVIETSFEFNASGTFKQVERFKSFMNAPEFIKIFKAKTDVVLSKDIPGFAEQLPKLKGNAFTQVIVKRGEQLIEFMEMIKQELAEWAKKPAKERNNAVPLVMFSRATQAAIDLRLVNPEAQDTPTSKANSVVSNVKKIYDDTSSYNGTQMIFADRYLSPDYTEMVDNYSVFKNPQTSKRFNLYEDMRDKLIALGVPASEIAIVSEIGDEKKEQLFEKVNNGDVRIILGSTERMGVGVNAQRLMAAVHHVDAPARPMDFTQRNGRIIRQGNTHAQMGKDVEIFTYGVEKTLDVTAYQRLAFKQAFIEQVLRGDIDSRMIEDAADEGSISGQSFEEMMGNLSGSQYAMLLADLKGQLKKAEISSKNYERGLTETRHQVNQLSQKVVPLKMSIEKKLDAIDVIQKLFPDGKVTSVAIGGKSYTDKIGEVLQNRFTQFSLDYSMNRNTEPLRINVNGNERPAVVMYDPHNEKFSYIMRIGEDEIKGESTGGTGFLTSIASKIKSVKSDIAALEATLRDTQAAIPSLEKRLNAPNKSADKVQELKDRVSEVSKLMAQESEAEEKRVAVELEKAAADDVRFREVDSPAVEMEQIRQEAIERGDFMVAPNGEPTKLSERQWSQVRTKAFKEWFGDWEKAARIEKLRRSATVKITGNEITPSEDLKEYKRNALEYGKNLRGEYVNTDTGESISVSRGSLTEVLSHSISDDGHIQSVAAIPKIIEESIYIETLENEDLAKHPDVTSYDFFVCGLRIGSEDYTAKAVIANSKSNGRYYDHKLSRIEKGKLLSTLPVIRKSGEENNLPESAEIEESPSLSEFKDKRLLSILQTNSSKVVDANGEPKVVYHGTDAIFTEFDHSQFSRTGFFFAENKYVAESFAKGSGRVIEAFVNIKKPTYIKNALVVSKKTAENYDGVVSEESGQHSTTMYVVFNSNQIKSATENTGEFISESNDIRHRDEQTLRESISEVRKHREWERKQQSTYKSREKRHAEATEVLQELSEKFNVPIEIAATKADLPYKLRYAKTTFSGAYDRYSGRVYFVLDAIQGVENAQRTFLHEVVSHKGIDGLMGKENANKFYDKVFESLPEDEQKRLFGKYEGNKTVAGDETVARMAEGDVTIGVMQRVISAVRRFFREVLGIPLRISDNDIRYVLWKSKNNLQRTQNLGEVFRVLEREKQLKAQLYPKDKSLFDKIKDVAVRFREVDAPKSAVSRFRVSGEKNTAKSGAIKLQESLQDATIKIHLLQNEIKRRGGTIDATTNVYESLNHRDSIASKMIDSYNDKYIKPFMNFTKGLNIEYIKVSEYMLAKHSIERHKSGLSALSEDGNWTLEYTQGVVDDFESKVSKEKLAEFWKLWRGATQEILTIGVRSGRMNLTQMREILAKGWDHYVPLRGKDFEFEGQMSLSDVFHYDYGLGHGGVNSSKKVSDIKAHGRQSKADDPIATLQNMAAQEIYYSSVNAANLSLFRLANKYKEMTDLFEMRERWYVKRGEKWYEEDERPDQAEIEASNAARREIQGYELALKNITDADKIAKLQEKINDARSFVTVTRRELDTGGYQGGVEEAHNVVVMKDGFKYVIRMGDPEVAQAINGSTGTLQSWLSKYPGTVTRYMAQLATSKNPAFILPNFVRDVQQAAMYNWVDSDGNSSGFAKHAMSSWKVLHRSIRGQATPLTVAEMGSLNILNEADRKVLHSKFGKDRVNDTLYELFAANGGETGYVHMISPKELQKRLEKEVRISMGQFNVHAKAWKGINVGIDYMANMSENAVRYATFLSQIERGNSVFDAVSYAKNITVNFNRKGKYSKGIGSLFMFFNAGVQGAQNFYSLWGNKQGKSASEIAKQRARFIAANAVMAATGFVFSYWMTQMLLGLIGDDGEEMQLSDYERRTNLIIPMGGKDYFKIPIPISFRPFYSLGVMAHDYVEGKVTAGDVLTTFSGAMMDALSPLPVDYSLDKDNAASLLKPIIPSAARPFTDLMYNQDFAGRRIYNKSPYNPYTPDSQLGLKNVNIIALNISKWLNELGGGNEITPAGLREDGTRNMLNWLDLNPSILEHLFVGYTGGIGRIFNDTFITLTSDDKEVRHIPIVNRFIGETYKKDPGYEYFNVKRNIERLYRENKAVETLGIESATFSKEEFPHKKAEYTKLKDKVSGVEKRINRIEKRMREIPFGTDEYKEYEKQIDKLQREFLKEYNNDKRN